MITSDVLLFLKFSWKFLEKISTGNWKHTVPRWWVSSVAMYFSVCPIEYGHKGNKTPCNLQQWQFNQLCKREKKQGPLILIFAYFIFSLGSRDCVYLLLPILFLTFNLFMDKIFFTVVGMIEANKSNREEILFLTLNILYKMRFIFFPQRMYVQTWLTNSQREQLLLIIRDPPWKQLRSDKEWTETGASFC